MTPASAARIHLLPARSAPVVAVLRRKPSRLFHVLRWDTRDDRLEPGSWFRGRLFPARCDVSFDGEWMVYLAIGSQGNTWNGVCRLPWLKTVAEGTNFGTWCGGGCWTRPGLLRLWGWELSGNPTETLPFEVQPNDGSAVLAGRLERDGWTREGEGERLTLWCRPTRHHPTLRLTRRLAFSLDEHPGLLDGADWAAWDALGSLVAARAGGIERWSLRGLSRGSADFRRSLEDLSPP